MADENPKPPETALHVMPGVSVDRNHIEKPKVKRRRLDVADYVAGVLKGDRPIIGRTLTLIESTNEAHREKARQVLDQLMPHTGKSIRLGISGVPGAGKSTFIEALGVRLADQGKRVAVLAIDPSSELTGGSILGDKTRMENLSRHDNALVRPTACGSWHGGVARTTRESILICEAAGFDVVIIETVGVGQSETQVASMVDFFLLLMLAGAGDELQGIKRGILELADTVVINKADGENLGPAQIARAQFTSALRLLHSSTDDGWTPKVLTCSSLTGEGIDEIWHMVDIHRGWLESTGRLKEKRAKQALFWMTQAVAYEMHRRFENHPRVKQEIEEIKQQVREGELAPFGAAERLVRLAFDQEPTS